MQILHHNQRHIAIRIVDGRCQAWGMLCLNAQRVGFVVSSIKWQRPAFADQAYIGQRLLDHQAPGRTLDNENQIEIAIANFANFPTIR